MSTFGGIWYGYIKYKAQMTSMKTKAQDKAIIDMEENNPPSNK